MARSLSALSFKQRDFLSQPVGRCAWAICSANPGHTLRFQDGCNNRCSSVLSSFVRGRSRARQPMIVVAPVRGNWAGKLQGEVVFKAASKLGRLGGRELRGRFGCWGPRSTIAG